VSAVEIARTEGCGATSEAVFEFWAVDECGNESPRQRRTYRVVDTTAPVLSGVPADATVECDAVPAPAMPTASDACGAVTIRFAEARTDGDCPFRYTLTRTWTAEDECGNAASESRVLTVVDLTPPVLDAPDDLTVECPAPATGPGSEAAWLASASATDDCGVPVVRASRS
jgi:hypothetical protein